MFNNSNELQRSQLLRGAITYNGQGIPEGHVLRFLGNNDLFYFTTHHGVERTKMAAVLPFTLPGIPLIYNGEEIGKSGHPYSSYYIFHAGLPNDNYDGNGFFPYYQKLIDIRQKYYALRSSNYNEIAITPGSAVFGFRRWEGDQNLFTIINMRSTVVNVTASLPVNELGLDTLKTYYLTDLLSGQVISGIPSQLSELSLSMQKYTSKIFLLSDTMTVVSVDDIYAAGEVPVEFSISQNYPNPFNPVTSITFRLPEKGNVELRVYDILGSEAAVLVDGEMNTGEHTVQFDGSSLTSGVYIYRVTYNGNSYSKKMMLLK